MRDSACPRSFWEITMTPWLAHIVEREISLITSRSIGGRGSLNAHPWAVKTVFNLGLDLDCFDWDIRLLIRRNKVSISRTMLYRRAKGAPIAPTFELFRWSNSGASCRKIFQISIMARQSFINQTSRSSDLTGTIRIPDADNFSTSGPFPPQATDTSKIFLSKFVAKSNTYRWAPPQLLLVMIKRIFFLTLSVMVFVGGTRLARLGLLLAVTSPQIIPCIFCRFCNAFPDNDVSVS